MYKTNAVYELVFDGKDEYIILSIYVLLNFNKRNRYESEVRKE